MGKRPLTRLHYRQDPSGKEQPGHRPDLVHGLVEAEGPAAMLLWGNVGYESVSGRGTDSLPCTIQEADHQDQPPRIGKIKQRLGKTREAVAPYGKSLLLPQPVCQVSRSDLQESRGALGYPLDETDNAGLHPEDVSEKQWQRTDRHFAAKVIQQADYTQDLDIMIEGFETLSVFCQNFGLCDL